MNLGADPDDDERATPLTQDDVRAIVTAMRERREARRRLSLKALARRFGVCPRTLQRIEARYTEGAE